MKSTEYRTAHLEPNVVNVDLPIAGEALDRSAPKNGVDPKLLYWEVVKYHADYMPGVVLFVMYYDGEDKLRTDPIMFKEETVNKDDKEAALRVMESIVHPITQALGRELQKISEEDGKE